MNIFVLDRDPFEAAKMHCDQHVTKMILETAQLLSTEARRLGITDDRLYKSTHVNHPCSVWLRDKPIHVDWLWRLTCSLGQQHEIRFGTVHKSCCVALVATSSIYKATGYRPVPLEQILELDHALAMPDEFKDSDPVDAYRAYYRYKHQQWTIDKGKGMKYTKVEPPEWLNL